MLSLHRARRLADGAKGAWRAARRHGGAAMLSVGLALCAHPGEAAFKPAAHPYILWTTEDAAAIRKKVETEPWAKAGCEKMLAAPDAYGKNMVRLFKVAVLGDAAAAEAEKKELLSVVRSAVPLGGSQEFTVLRYDILYDRLAAEERREVEQAFRKYIEYSVITDGVFDPSLFNDSKNYSRYDARKYGRANWLPNIIWPRKVSGNLMAVALGDEALIRRTRDAYGSWKWYFDEYLCDTGFYAEEFSKMGATPGAMLLYCMGMERLGLDELGFGYKGKGGATMRGHIESLLHLGFPRVDLGTSRPHYPMVTMGDLRQSGSSQQGAFGGAAFQHSLVRGYLPDGPGGNERWVAHGAWGGTRRGQSPQWDTDKTEKMQAPLWFEIGQKRWPESGFAYFLAQMRGPDEDKYGPTLFFGLDPIDPANVKPPAAPSAVWPERGLVMLRADESPAYWESEAPAVGLRLAADYAHNVCDSFALIGFYAFNRPIYLNRQVARSYAFGWSRSVQSHCGVMVDGMEPKFTSAVAVRRGFNPLAKFVAARSTEVWPGIAATRALVLAREYLLDVFQLASDQPHTCHWLVHALGQPAPDDMKAWAASTDLADAFYMGKIPVEDEKTLLPAGKTWAVTVNQTCALADPRQSRVGEAWWAAQVGVRMTMLGEAGTKAYVHRTPERDPADPFLKPGRPEAKPEPPNEFGGVTLVAARQAPAVTFVALHEPFRGGRPQVADFRRIQQTGQGVAVAVVGPPGGGINDRIMIGLGEDVATPLTLAGDGESFTFADWAYVRVGKDRVEAGGNLRAMKVRVTGSPRLLLNGHERPAAVKDGFFLFQ
ncbi:MAG: hypothetical protein NTX87_04885 [Planctomycetota bacterium]|nr:hypothetical protein [Planctomycetota bacterium]